MAPLRRSHRFWFAAGVAPWPCGGSCCRCCPGCWSCFASATTTTRTVRSSTSSAATSCLRTSGARRRPPRAFQIPPCPTGSRYSGRPLPGSTPFRRPSQSQPLGRGRPSSTYRYQYSAVSLRRAQHRVRARMAAQHACLCSYCIGLGLANLAVRFPPHACLVDCGTSAPGLTRLAPCHICTGTRLAPWLSHLHRDGLMVPPTICVGTGLRWLGLAHPGPNAVTDVVDGACFCG